MFGSLFSLFQKHEEHMKIKLKEQKHFHENTKMMFLKTVFKKRNQICMPKYYDQEN